MRSTMRSSVKVKDLREHFMEPGLRPDRLVHDRGHLRLPTLRICIRRHMALEALEVGDLHVSEEGLSFHIYRVVGAAGLLQGAKHLRPDRLMATAVLRLLTWPHLHHERNSLHGLPQRSGEAAGLPAVNHPRSSAGRC